MQTFFAFPLPETKHEKKHGTEKNLKLEIICCDTHVTPQHNVKMIAPERLSDEIDNNNTQSGPGVSHTKIKTDFVVVL